MKERVIVAALCLIVGCGEEPAVFRGTVESKYTYSVSYAVSCGRNCATTVFSTRYAVVTADGWRCDIDQAVWQQVRSGGVVNCEWQR